MIAPSRLNLLNGVEPAPGQLCSSFQLLHFYENGQVTDAANVTYFKFGSAWYRIYFEASTIFWRCDGPPGIPENDGVASGLILNDLSGVRSVVGHQLEQLSYDANDNELIATLSFSGGGSVELRYLTKFDRTEVSVGR
jgi:hypothetical protein